MNYMKITKNDICNGEGLRVVLWLSGCSHHCYNCQNPQTWNPNSGIIFGENAKYELFSQLSKDYISGLTLSGGDPLHDNNLLEVLELVEEIRVSFPKKTIWLYTGYEWEEIMNHIELNEECNEYGGCSNCIENENMGIRKKILSMVDIVVDGQYIDAQRDITLKWRGSTNQRVIDVQESLKQEKIILWCD